MSTDVLGYLLGKGLHVKRAGGTECHLPCFFCGEDPQKRGRLYVNVDSEAEIPGLFECKICGTHGALPTIMKHFGDQPARKQDEDRWINRREIFAEAARFYHEQLGEHPDVYQWLRGPQRMLTLETIQDFKIGYASDDGLYPYLREKGFTTAEMLETGLLVEVHGRIQDSLRKMVTIPYFVAGNVVTIRGRSWPSEEGSKYKTLGGNSARLFNSDATWNTDELIITEGEFDCLIVRQLGFENVVGLPGANTWQDAWDGYVANVRKIYTVFDNDSAGAQGEAKLKNRFGAKIRPVILSSEGKADPTSWHASGGLAEDFARIISSAGTSGLLITVDDAYDEHVAIQGLDGLKFGIEKLDFAISPGLLPSQVMVPLAKSGCMAGDTEIRVNRAGKGFAVRLADMFDRWTGGVRYTWDRTIPTYVQRADDGVIRLGEVEEVWQSGVKETFTVTTDSGRTVRATAEHPFLTPEGWTKLGDLRVGDEVCVNALEQVGVETVVSVTRYGFEMTYDISVRDDPHNFMANGFVVHNTGKTLLLLNLMHRMAMQPEQEDATFLFVSLEQTRGEWFERARRIWRFYNPESDDQECLDFWRDRLFIVDKNRLSPDEFRVILEEYADRRGRPPSCITLDYIGYWAQAFRGDRYERVSDAVMELKSIAKDWRVPIIAPHQVSRIAKYGNEPDVDAARDAGVVEETADFVITMWSPDSQLGRKEEDKSGIVKMRLGKSRHGGRGQMVDLQFAPLTLALLPYGDPLQQYAINEMAMDAQHESWEDAVFKHRMGISGTLRRDLA